MLKLHFIVVKDGILQSPSDPPREPPAASGQDSNFRKQDLPCKQTQRGTLEKTGKHSMQGCKEPVLCWVLECCPEGPPPPTMPPMLGDKNDN